MAATAALGRTSSQEFVVHAHRNAGLLGELPGVLHPKRLVALDELRPAQEPQLGAVLRLEAHGVLSEGLADAEQLATGRTGGHCGRCL